MSNPTTPFGWQMPTATDLVTDLPADFEVFGQAVATSMSDLLGGTSGQILAKNSNTDMDFVWIANDQGDITGITATSPLTGGGTSGAITVGIQDATTSVKGSVQLSDSTSTTSSVLAATPTAVKSAYDLATTGNLKVSNPILNSSMNVWQRGTSGTNNSFVSGTLGCNADRWQNYLGGGAITVSRQSTNDTTNLPSIQYCARVQRNSGQTAAGSFYHSQSMETINSIPYAGKQVTVSYYARAGANFSAASSILNGQIISGTGTDQNVLSGFTGSTSIATANATLTTTWQRFTFTGTVGATATQLGLNFSYTTVGTAGTNDYFEITGVQIDMGSVALPFRANGSSYQAELAMCQRYYFRSTPGTNYGGHGTYGSARTTTVVKSAIPFPVQMRVIPTSIDYSTLAVNDGQTIIAVTAVALSAYESQVVAYPEFTVGSASLTQYRPYHINNNNNAAAYLGFSAEL
jgi:hypothetical protein